MDRCLCIKISRQCLDISAPLAERGQRERVAFLSEGRKLGVVGVSKTVASIVEESWRLVVLGRAIVPTMQLPPNLKPESTEVATDRPGVGVASFQLTGFDKAIAHHTLGNVGGWS